MKNSLNIPSTFSLKKELQTIVDQLLNILNPDLIYLSTIREDSTSVYSLHLILKPGGNLSKEEVGSLENLQQTFPQFIIQWSNHKELRKALSESNIYFIKQCYFGHVIYSRTNSIDPLAETTLKAATLNRKVRERVDRDINDFTDQFSTMNFHVENKLYEKAIVDLGAILAKLLGYVESIYKKEPSKIKSLKHHVEYIAHLSISFSAIFHSKNKKLIELLSSIDNIHMRGYYDREKDGLDNDGFYERLNLVKVVFKIVQEIVDGTLSSCMELEHQRHPQKKTMASGNNLPLPFDAALHEVLRFLQSKFDVHSVFLISKSEHNSFEEQILSGTKLRQQRFACTLLLVTPKSISMNPAELMDLVLNEMDGRMRIHFILETFPRMYENLEWGKRFPQWVLNDGKCFFQADEQLSKYINHKDYWDASRWESINERWKARNFKANHLNDLSDIMFDKEDPIVALSLTKEALIQSCIGMLYVFWGYTSPYTSLPYLIHLCSHFTDFPKQILFNTSYESQRMFHLINQSHRYIRYNNPYKVTTDDKDNANALASRFIAKAEDAVENHLKFLKTNIYQEDKKIFELNYNKIHY